MWWNGLLLAVRAIRRNVLRSFLTILGVVIGVSAVIIMVTLGDGATQSVKDQISSLGSNLLYVRPGQRLGPGRDSAGAPNFKLDDADAIRDQISSAALVVPTAGAAVTVVYQAENWSTTVTGSTSAYFTAGSWELASGRIFTEIEERAGRTVCVIGQTVRKELFGGENPVGSRDPHQAFLVRRHRAAQGQGPGRLRHGRRRHRRDAAAGRPATPERQRRRDDDPGGGEGGRLAGPGDRGDRNPDARAAQRQRQRGRQLHGGRHASDRRDALGHDSGPDDAPRRRGGHQPARGRDRHHEHHVGVGHRAHARDRHPPGHRRARAGSAPAVPDRVGRARVVRRPDRRRRRQRDCRRRGARHPGAVRVQPGDEPAIVPLLRPDWDRLRLLPGSPGGAARIPSRRCATSSAEKDSGDSGANSRDGSLLSICVRRAILSSKGIGEFPRKGRARQDSEPLATSAASGGASPQDCREPPPREARWRARQDSNLRPSA